MTEPCLSCGIVGCIAPDVDEINWDLGGKRKTVTKAQWNQLKRRPAKVLPFQKRDEGAE